MKKIIFLINTIIIVITLIVFFLPRYPYSIEIDVDYESLAMRSNEIHFKVLAKIKNKSKDVQTFHDFRCPLESWELSSKAIRLDDRHCVDTSSTQITLKPEEAYARYYTLIGSDNLLHQSLDFRMGFMPHGEQDRMVKKLEAFDQMRIWSDNVALDFKVGL